MLLKEDRKVGRPEERVFVEDVRLDAAGPEHALIVLLRDGSRPGCLFGWRWPMGPEWSDASLEDPYFPAMIATANLGESLIGGPGLPRECDPETITWF